MSELPEGWILSDINSVCQYIQRGKSPKYDKETQNHPIINQKCVRWNKIQSEHLKFVTSEFWENIDPIRFLQKGDVLWNSTGTGTIGRAAIFDELPNYPKAIVDSHVTILRSHSGINPKYLYYWIHSPGIQNKIEDMQSGTTNQVELSKKAIQIAPICLAPENEQKRIVEKLDQLLEKVNSAKARLDQIPYILSNFRKSALNHAFSGTLTKNLRVNKKYLEKIGELRKEEWKKKQVLSFKRRGKPPQNDKWEEKYNEPSFREKDRLIGLPNTWDCHHLEYIADVVDPNPSHRNPQYFDQGFIFLSTSQFSGQDGWDYNNVKYVSEETVLEQENRCSFTHRSIAFSRKGTIGKIRLLPSDIRFALLDSVVVINPSELVDEKYINFCLRADVVQEQVKRLTRGVALKQVSVGAVRSLVIPIP